MNQQGSTYEAVRDQVDHIGLDIRCGLFRRYLKAQGGDTGDGVRQISAVPSCGAGGALFITRRVCRGNILIDSVYFTCNAQFSHSFSNIQITSLTMMIIWKKLHIFMQ